MRGAVAVLSLGLACARGGGGAPAEAPVDDTSAGFDPYAPTEMESRLARVEMIEDAKIALHGDDADSALALLASHREQFPQSDRHERDQLMMAALCAAGRTDDALAQAAEVARDQAEVCDGYTENAPLQCHFIRLPTRLLCDMGEKTCAERLRSEYRKHWDARAVPRTPVTRWCVTTTFSARDESSVCRNAGGTSRQCYASAAACEVGVEAMRRGDVPEHWEAWQPPEHCAHEIGPCEERVFEPPPRRVTDDVCPWL